MNPRLQVYRLAGYLPAPIKRLIVGAREVRFLIGVIGVVMDDANRVLLFRHSYRPFAPWGLPSGFLKDNERLEDSIKREIAEETGLSVDFVEILHTEARSRPRRVDVWMRYRSSASAPPRGSAEVEEARFFAFDELPPLIREQEQFLTQNRERLFR